LRIRDNRFTKELLRTEPTVGRIDSRLARP
jgi:hypothetical protein